MREAVGLTSPPTETLRNLVGRGVRYSSRPLTRSRSFQFLSACRPDIVNLVKGAMIYRRTGTSPDSAYQSMINLHCRTQGYSNDILAWLVSMKHRPVAFPNADGVLGNLTRADLAGITNEIQQNGYYIFPHLLSADVCARLVEFALTAECTPSPQAAPVGLPNIYHRDQPVADIYKFDEQTLLDHPDVQKLISDHSILSLAQSYLASPPILDIVTMWWSTAFSREASVDAAQLYHFDMDRIRWLKIFFYLTDVTPTNGPHCYVAKSHKRKGQPLSLLKRGYARIPDEDIARYYQAGDIKEITGPRGTMFVADTRGFHKGMPISNGDRLLLQFEFTSSLFGGAYTKAHLKNNYDAHLLALAKRYRRVYSKFIVNE